MLINEVCKECNLTKKAVEYYTEQGLIQPRITENGYRQFSETDALKLKRIAVLRGLGFSVPEIRTILENDTHTAIYDVLNRRELEIAELQTKQALIKQLLVALKMNRHSVLVTSKTNIYYYNEEP